LLLGATISFFTAIHFIPLADATAISFVAPLLLTALSIPLLGEKVGSRRWSAVAVGFLGALIVIRPGLGATHWAATMALLSAVTFSLYQIATRKLSTVDAPITTFLYTGAVGTLVMTIVVPFVWRWPTAEGWAIMACLGVLGGFGHFLLIQAFRRAPAATLAPFNFATILWTGLLGYIVFGDVPDLATIVGTSVIIASGIYVFHRESVAGRNVTTGRTG
jgi:drug/metabolite transporter (DMT)-like permease